MALSQTKSYFQWTKIALANAGILLVLSPSIFLHLPSLAQNTPKTPDITCSDSDSLVIKAYTNNYYVTICGNSNDKYSMIVESKKSSSSGIKLDARPLDNGKNLFEAKAEAGKFTYTMDTSKEEFKIVEIQPPTPVRPVPGRPRPKPRPVIKTTIEKINTLLMS